MASPSARPSGTRPASASRPCGRSPPSPSTCGPWVAGSGGGSRWSRSCTGPGRTRSSGTSPGSAPRGAGRAWGRRCCATGSTGSEDRRTWRAASRRTFRCTSGSASSCVRRSACPTAPTCGRCGGPEDDCVKTLDWETIRLFLHVLAATVWGGGQITLAALGPALRGSAEGGTKGAARAHNPIARPALRGSAEGVTKVAARAYNRIAWPAFGVLVVTGIWNVVALDDTSASFQNTLMLKYVLVLASGVTAYLHQRATSPRAMAVYGALT